MARSIQQWLDAYAVSHQNATNKAVHWVCVPVITWTVIALLWSIPFPGPNWMNPGSLFLLTALVFYLRLSLTIAIGMAAFSVFCVALVLWHEAVLNWSVAITALVLFVVAWIGQFVGHKIEGAKPSFFEDLQFLLIGPAWLLSFIYRRLGWSY